VQFFLKNFQMSKNTEKTRLTDRKRAAILAAAASEFQQYGFGGTSMDRIAATADVSKRTVYNHFASKDELFLAIVAELGQRCGVNECPYSSNEPLEDQLLAIAKGFAEMMTNDDFIKLARVVLSRLIQSPELASSIRGVNDPFHAAVNWIKAAKKDSRLSVTSPEQAAAQFTGLIKASAFWPQLIGGNAAPSKRELKQITKSAVAMFLDHYQV
jgi:TetR/AcrR family transcriptional regulator of autoinduction and epiphytic fitness